LNDWIDFSPCCGDSAGTLCFGFDHRGICAFARQHFLVGRPGRFFLFQFVLDMVLLQHRNDWEDIAKFAADFRRQKAA